MNRNDGLCLFGDGVFYFSFVDVHGVRADIHKNGGCAAENKSIGSGNKSIGRHDHLVARLYISQKRSHLRGMGAGGGEECLCRTGMFFYPAAAESGKCAVSADLVIFDCLCHVLGSLIGAGRNIKINHMQSFFSLSSITEGIIANFKGNVHNNHCSIWLSARRFFCSWMITADRNRSVHTAEMIPPAVVPGEVYSRVTV